MRNTLFGTKRTIINEKIIEYINKNTVNISHEH